MKFLDNIEAVAKLQPDYLGFIFYEKSARFNEDNVPNLPAGIQKIGVFVDAEIDFVLEKVKNHQLHGIQLHGNESPEYCRQLKNKLNSLETGIKIIKVFSIKDEFDFSVLNPFETVVDFYLFDTKGKLPGGNGYTFNWEVLKNYPSEKPFFLSGGIGMEELEKLKSLDSNLPIHAIDVNSKFELEPGLKNVELLKEFIYQLRF
ncbi:phosphoribosylanthranilate isomerase [Galbibacter mesophilus]|uniref:phosphoribosylanthranilate isomerase n=1 Tax=Galbibacter mesophilus TaxID=379069 RepID=UPI00191C9A12|nr:phosphoribosylanthranilate isomerase [Galbibacter mesophilus]MCM5661636.1 phosphoribosylanthranilate isomerase [Galbibacter mesophilus]